jgi:hypothetical protein
MLYTQAAAHRVRKDNKDLLEQQGLRVHKESKVRKDSKVQMDKTAQVLPL